MCPYPNAPPTLVVWYARGYVQRKCGHPLNQELIILQDGRVDGELFLVRLQGLDKPVHLDVVFAPVKKACIMDTIKICIYSTRCRTKGTNQ